jgi:hypothetical protein
MRLLKCLGLAGRLTVDPRYLALSNPSVLGFDVGRRHERRADGRLARVRDPEVFADVPQEGRTRKIVASLQVILPDAPLQPIVVYRTTRFK